ncbi:phytoene/squalene synthase family protein [Enterovirga aerilata]|uniref:Phytoene/squalene synthase family protein n=1 Tax=Enterovirga aerilata TaxID=2730920 RepID=A0A849I8G4_9HYPH|nr:phytoene/squalene synthase family protein [Enterovirga sp. DB1703]NNM72699.1 phytoene/squalene synthase family protein [Enterovirga sp. DB1703]
MSEDLVRAATETIARGSKSFAAAARLFDRPTRESAVMLYAWCRHCDDVVDDQEFGFSAREGASREPQARLAELEARTCSALAGEPQTVPAFAALQEVARRHGIPERYPLQHLAGFRMDLEERRYGTIEDTLDYAYHVAGVVGVMMAHIMGVRDPAVLDRASDLGIAFQLTNIARDIVDDAATGRTYLPAAWLREAGIPPGEVAEPRHRAALAKVAARLIDLAEPYYASARIGVAALPPRSAWAIATAHGVYRQIGIEVRRRGARAWDARVSTSKLQKLGQVVRGGATALMTRIASPGPAPRRGLYERPA